MPDERRESILLHYGCRRFGIVVKLGAPAADPLGTPLARPGVDCRLPAPRPQTHWHSPHFRQKHLNSGLLGTVVWPHFLQRNHPSGRANIGLKTPPTHAIWAANDLLSHCDPSALFAPGGEPGATFVIVQFDFLSTIWILGWFVLISPAIRSGRGASYPVRALPPEPFRANGLVGQRPTYPRTQARVR